MFPFTSGQCRSRSICLLLCLLLIVAPTLASAHNSLVARSDNCNLSCTTDQDELIDNAQKRFFLSQWVKRGRCIRSDKNCYCNLERALTNLNELRKAEYAGAAGILALLPTINTLLGAPTVEIWRLWVFSPIGGFIVMLLSFGGAILPTNVEDYEAALDESTVSVGREIDRRKSATGKDEVVEKMTELTTKLRSRMSQQEPTESSKWSLRKGFVGMMLLLLTVQACMAVVEQGGVVPWWCDSGGWMHTWYFVGVCTSAVDNWFSMPFSNNYKLYVSTVPYDIDVVGGTPISKGLDHDEVEKNVARAVKRLIAVTAAKVEFKGSSVYTQPRNSTLVMVSVVGKRWGATLFKPVSKMMTIGVFVTGTALFAATSLLALVMAIAVLAIVVAAGVFGRALAEWMVDKALRPEPIIQVVVRTEGEAHLAIAHILNLQSDEGDMLQVEMDGHVFVSDRRVTRDNRWRRLQVGVLGVLAPPFDLRKVLSSQHSPLSYVSTGQIDGASKLSHSTIMSDIPLLPRQDSYRSTFGSTAGEASSQISRAAAFDDGHHIAGLMNRDSHQNECT